MRRTKKKPPKEPFVIRSFTLTPTTAETLQQLSQEASDRLGWTVSNSAVIRALLSHVARQTPAWASSALYPFIEGEIVQGRVWGSKKR